MVEDLQLSDSSGTRVSSDSENEFHSPGQAHQRRKPGHSAGQDSVRSQQDATDPELEFRPRSVSLHRHLSYDEYKQLQYEKFKRAGALGVMSGKHRYDNPSGKFR